MKKSIVLLISLFFISSISVLILQNLEDTDTYIKTQSSKLSKAQILTLVKNVHNEAKENSKEFDNVIGQLFPIDIEGIKLEFQLISYDKIDINSLKDEKNENLRNFFNNNNISNYGLFKEIYYQKARENNIDIKNNNIVSNNKQLDDIIDTFVKETYDNKISNIRNDLGFIPYDSKKKLYELFIKISYLGNISKAYYILDEEGESKYFELSFK